MAYGEFGGLLPSEAYYSGPRGGIDAAKVEAGKKASYLSSMDQYYAQLEETERQFDVMSAFQEKRFGLEERKFEWEKEYREDWLKMQLRLGLAGPAASRYATQYQYKLGMEQLEWEKEEAEMTEDFLEEYFKTY